MLVSSLKQGRNDTAHLISASKVGNGSTMPSRIAYTCRQWY